MPIVWTFATKKPNQIFDQSNFTSETSVGSENLVLQDPN